MMKPRLSIVLPTEAKLGESKVRGLLSRWKMYFSEYSKKYEVECFSCDSTSFEAEIGVKHHALPVSLNQIKYGNQLFYNIYIAFKCLFMTQTVLVIGASFFSLPLMRLLGKKIILSYQYDYATTTLKDFGGAKGISAGVREFLSLQSANIVFCSTNELMQKVANKYNKRVKIVPNFVDTSKFVPQQKEAYIFYCGRICWSKGIDYLIDGLAEVMRRYPTDDLKLVLAGAGEIEAFKNKSVALGLKNVEFLGPIDNSDIPRYTGRAKIFVLPSVNREGHPVALIEAMACGCACIATDVPGNNNLIVDGENGILVRSKDSNAVASGIIRVLQDDQLCERLMHNAMKTAAKFSIAETLQCEIDWVKEEMSQYV